MKKSLAIAMLIVILLGSFALVGSAWGIQKFFIAQISPSNAFSLQQQDYTLTLTDLGSNPNGNKLGSATIRIPDGWEIVGEITVNDSSWNVAVFQLTQLNLTASSSADCISPGESIAVSFAAIAPSVTESTDFTWFTITYTSPSWAGDTFTLSRGSSQPIVTVTSSLFYVTFYKSGATTADVYVIYMIDGGASQSILVPPTGVEVSVLVGQEISFTYPDTASDTSGSLYSLNRTEPEWLPATTENATVTGYYDKSFGITGSSGSQITAETIRYPGSSTDLIPGLPPIPGGALGFYFIVEVEGTSRGTFVITIHYDDSGLTETQEQNLRLWMGDPVDFNGDGKVDGNDINMTQTAIKSHVYSSEFDINHDGRVDKYDLKIVQEYASNGLLIPTSAGEPGQTRLPWLDITVGSVDIENNLIYGETDHFSGFGVH